MQNFGGGGGGKSGALWEMSKWCMFRKRPSMEKNCHVLALLT